MTRLLLTVALIAAIPMAASSDSLWNKIKKGASDAGDAVGDAASDVGNAIGNTAEDVGDAIEKTVDSTTEMVTDEETPEQTRQRMDSMASQTLSQLLSENPQAAALYEVSHGYAVFDARQVTFIGAAGYGRGVAVDKATGARHYMSMGTGGVGLAFGVGGFERKIVILFESEGDFLSFVYDGYDATAEANAKDGDEDDTLQARFVEGRSFFYLSKKGWRVAASATGTKYWRDKDLN